MATIPGMRLPTELEQFDRQIRLMGWATTRSVEKDDEKLRYRRIVTARRGNFRIRIVHTRKVLPDGKVDVALRMNGAYTSTDRPSWCFLRNMDEMWQFAETFDTTLLISPLTHSPLVFPVPPPVPPPEDVSKCMCEKEELDERTAREALDQALVSRVLYNSRERRECRVYECPTQTGVFHLTSTEQWCV
jgi:hypothetical protein